MKPRYFLIWFCVAFYFEAATENVMCSSLQSAWHDTFSILCCKYTTHAYQLCFKQSNCPGFFAVVSNHTCCYHSNYWCHEARTEILRIRTVLIKLRTFPLMKCNRQFGYCKNHQKLKEKYREAHSLLRRVARRLCGTASPHRSHAALHIEQACVVEAVWQRHQQTFIRNTIISYSLQDSDVQAEFLM